MVTRQTDIDRQTDRRTDEGSDNTPSAEVAEGYKTVQPFAKWLTSHDFCRISVRLDMGDNRKFWPMDTHLDESKAKYVYE